MMAMRVEYRAARQGEPETRASAQATASEQQAESLPILVLLVDDRAMLRQGLRQLLEAEGDIQVVGEASNGEEALLLARRVEADVVLMDINMPRLNGIEATRRLAAEFPLLRVIGLSVYDDSTFSERMLRAGAVDFVSKSSSPDLVIAAVRRWGRPTRPHASERS